jgi:hypothetical protein
MYSMTTPGLPNVHSDAFQRGLALAALAGNFQSNARLLGGRDVQLQVTDGGVTHVWIIGIEITQRFMSF